MWIKKGNIKQNFIGKLRTNYSNNMYILFKYSKLIPHGKYYSTFCVISFTISWYYYIQICLISFLKFCVMYWFQVDSYVLSWIIKALYITNPLLRILFQYFILQTWLQEKSYLSCVLYISAQWFLKGNILFTSYHWVYKIITIHTSAKNKKLKFLMR